MLHLNKNIYKIEWITMLNLYQEIIMDHYRNPRNHGLLRVYDFQSEQRNSSCGDEIIMTGQIKNNSITAIGFEGKGCVISQAAASLLTEFIKDKSLESILSLDKDAILAMLAIPLGPVRLMCALLPLTALQKGIKEYQTHKT